MQINVVSIGNMVKECVILQPYQMVGPVIGGPCVYVSFALAKMGFNVGIVSYCSKDFLERVKTELPIVDTSGCIDYLVTTEDHLIYKKNTNKNYADYFKKAPVIYEDAISDQYADVPAVFIGPMDYEVDPHICQKLYEQKKRIYIDIGGYGGTTSYNHFPAKTKRGSFLLSELCKYAYVVKASEDDLSYFFPGVKAENAAKKLQKFGAKMVAVTMGEKGALSIGRDDKEVHYSTAYKVTKSRINPTGCGDIFTAGLIASLERESKLEQAVEFGNAAASLSLERDGYCVETRMPTIKEVNNRMVEWK